MSQQDESLEEDSDFQELEQKLTGLKPLPPSDEFLHRMGHRLDAMDGSRMENKIVWMRFAPVAAAACVVLTSAFLFRDHLLQQQQQQQAAAATDRLDPNTATGPAPVIHDNAPVRSSVSQPFGRILPASEGAQIDRFEPLSEGTFLRDVQNGEIIGVDENGQPIRRLNLEFENTQHFFDPATDTNIRIFSPHRESVLIPVETN